MNRSESIIRYLRHLKTASSEAVRKELFEDLLIRLFDFDPELRDIINNIGLGAEKTIMDIPHKFRTKTGYAGTQYGKVIIEFKKNLSKSRLEAKARLKEYVLGNWASGQEYDFTLIATDGSQWAIYALSYENLLRAENQEAIELEETDRFVLDENNAHDFFHFLDRYLFRTEKQTATLENVRRDFGASSGTFLTAIAILKAQFDKIKHLPEIISSFKQWQKFLSFAYGSFEASDEVFLVHTYLGIFSKILGYSVLEPDKFIDDETLHGIIGGDIFTRMNIINFIDDDFYNWPASEGNFKALEPAFRKIITKTDQYDFTHVGEDILKGMYQELIDPENRHALGEYYTPDWLCEKIVTELEIKPDSMILDPACGSGSFLRAAIDRLKREYPGRSASDIAQQVVGMDIHPLSVRVAKSTVLMALGNKIRASRSPITIRIFHANALSPAVPGFLETSFDLVIGNPPWLTYKNVKNKEYRKDLHQLADRYELLPQTANIPNLELAATFIPHSSYYFSKTDGQLAFVLPRSFLTADHHDNIRVGEAMGFEINKIWDLKGISPLFHVPSCVFFCKKREIRLTGKPKPIDGLIFSGKFEQRDASLDAVKHQLKAEKTQWHYVKLGRHSAFSEIPSINSGKSNYYKSVFRQGATMIPRNFYFVEVSKDDGDLTNRILSAETSKEINEASKKPWKGSVIKGRIRGKFIFSTALAKNVAPFGLIRPPMAVLPITINRQKQIELLTLNDFVKNAEPDIFLWFEKAENLWKEKSTESNKNISSINYLNWLSKLTDQDLTKRYLVIYNGSGKDANAVVIDRKKSDMTFIADSKTYWFGTNNANEAYYVASFLNSDSANQRIKAFQTTGLFGPRDIHKRILEVPLPCHDAKNADCKLLSELGRICEEKVSRLIFAIGDDYNIGMIRTQVRKSLSAELKEIDKVLEKML